MSMVAVWAWRLVCDQCGEHSGEHHTSPYDAVHAEQLPEGWTHADQTTCVVCHEENRQRGCVNERGAHWWDHAENQHLATIWAGGDDGRPEYRLRHCGYCARLEMQERGGEWLGFDRYGWLGDPDEVRSERYREREAMFKPERKDSCDA